MKTSWPGVRTPAPVAALHEVMPAAFNELVRIREVLENHFHDMQDFEFTIQDRTVYMLQTRNGKLHRRGRFPPLPAKWWNRA